MPSAQVVIEPLSPARHRVQFTASAGLRDKLERLRALMRSSVPDGDLAGIIEQAPTGNVTLLCSAHNIFMTESDYGRAAVSRLLRLSAGGRGPSAGIG